MTQNKFDIVIVGGGMIGAAIACLLAKEDIHIALVDQKQPEFEWEPDTVDLRVSAITKASENILTNLGVWNAIKQQGICSYQEMKVWDAKADGELHFDCAETEFTELGHIVENRITTACLWQYLKDLPTAECISNGSVVATSISENIRQIKLKDGRKLAAPLVIAADGRDSKLRSMLNISVNGWPYHQDGLVATVDTENPHQNTAWQRFLEDGPLAFLPLRTGQCSIVWTLKSETAQDYCQLDDASFLKVLEEASGGILGKMLKTSQRASFPLRFQYANHYTKPHFALIGDAAHAMHPLAGQGANAGLLDAAALAELIIETRNKGKPLSSSNYLRKYERWRKGDNLLMLVSMDILNKMFLQKNLAAISLRSTGMNWINHSSWVKSLFNHHAMGLRTDLPKLAQTPLD